MIWWLDLLIADHRKLKSYYLINRCSYLQSIIIITWEKRQGQGHTVRFQGLKGGRPSYDTEGTLVNFVKKEGRWKVSCSLLWQLNCRCQAWESTITFSPLGVIGIRDDYDPSSLAIDLSGEDQVEWLCNCYQLRCDDDYEKRGGKIHGPYVPDGCNNCNSRVTSRRFLDLLCTCQTSGVNSSKRVTLELDLLLCSCATYSKCIR